MKSLKPLIIGLAALACTAPAEVIQLTANDYTWSNSGYIEGTAQTSNAKLGLKVGSIRSYANDLSNSSDMTTPVSGIDDAGSWDDNYVLVHDGGTGVYKLDLSTGFVGGSSSVNGTGVDGISKMFHYNGAECFAAIDSNDNTVKYFEWGNSIPIASGPNVGSNYTGLEVIANNSVTDLNQLSLLVSRNIQDGAKIDQYFDGEIVGSYKAAGTSIITDMSYDNDTGILTTSFKDGRSGGGLANYDFADQVIPEPSSIALLGLAGLGAYAVRRFQM